MDSDCFPDHQTGSTHADGPLSDFDPVIGASVEGISTLPVPEAEDLDTYSLIVPPPLDWRSDSSSEAGSAHDLEDSGLPPSADLLDLSSLGESGSPPLIGEDSSTPVQSYQQVLLGNASESGQAIEVQVEDADVPAAEETTREVFGGSEKAASEEEAELSNRRPGDEDHSRIHALLTQLQMRDTERRDDHYSSLAEQEVCSHSMLTQSTETTGLLFSESHQRDLLGLLQCTKIGSTAHPSHLPLFGDVDAVLSVSYSQEDPRRCWRQSANGQRRREDSVASLPDDEYPEPVWMKLGEEPPEDEAGADGEQSADDHPSYKDVPGPCDPEDLLDGVIFGAKYLGSTQLKSDRNPSTNARMTQAQEAVDRIKAPEGESQPMTEVDLFISTKRIKVLTADTQEAMMDHSLQMISYIADIGDIVVLMARRKHKGQDADVASSSSQPQKKCLMICHVFSSEDAQVIAQAIGQAFGVAYQQFLQANGIKASDLKPGEYSNYLESQELYNGDLAHFSDSQNLRDIGITKAAGEILGLAVVESGWGSILPTVMVANLLHGGPAERCGELSIGDRIMSVNGTSLVGLPITTCQNILRDLKNQKYVKLSIVHCPPVTMAIIKRPDPKFQLGFSVEDGIICSLMRGGIAERGGIRVGHRIIEINGQSVVATPHDKIIQILTNAIGEIHLKTMPASTYRLLTGQEQPVFL
ncbi:amyloid beta A4 precursor protein-binding family A member 3 [Poecilia latipinna]|uniref:Amyloid-beta A4 precursor protein-binding family A member 3 n=1 Tax=Poecilia latipinna TaxID=48699 RepID=A0A3B3UT63_9TELE|nr:PREDICTED: amyloid beta A4 precursor protein-binding family A member 3-like [Poecilia latipinna]XP_014872495.1 PREDICTED: amyloid beta A4 precursor protein-binding family A member 3-like [Poecilia latipinna]